ncbi:MAG: hypothetical protein E6X23_05655 [Mixta calida]|uniref:hypothetical protein n=1 Tax=Mixta TaxID=2100764 RepID=UPI0010555876|nr:MULTISPECIES: hypothetical protein [Mixta]MBS6059578.1 hypothetical protein [Pantoea sp.]MCR1566398.1 hypothetical protein [Mixta sp.]MDU3814832.1 hypothetical protein [Pantoea sp.]MDU4290309.1 hypothetical protein [Mixta calida]MDU4941010.1 hypothetical protein [Mixta calida]
MMMGNGQRLCKIFPVRFNALLQLRFYRRRRWQHLPRVHHTPVFALRQRGNMAKKQQTRRFLLVKTANCLCFLQTTPRNAKRVLT